MRYSPNHMREDTSDVILRDKDIFSIDRLGIQKILKVDLILRLDLTTNN